MKNKHMLYIVCFFFQAEDGIRDSSTSRGLGDVYKRQDVAAAEGYLRELRAIEAHLPKMLALAGE